MNWFKIPIDKRARRGGEEAFTGRVYPGGEFMPFYVPRNLIPQVDEKDYSNLFTCLRREGISVTKEARDPHAYRPHQRVDVDRLRLMATCPEVVNKAILVSQDSYILDGHHRWDYHILCHDSPIEAYRIGRDFEEAIAALFAFPGTWTIVGHKVED